MEASPGKKKVLSKLTSTKGLPPPLLQVLPQLTLLQSMTEGTERYVR